MGNISQVQQVQYINLYFLIVGGALYTISQVDFNIQLEEHSLNGI